MLQPSNARLHELSAESSVAMVGGKFAGLQVVARSFPVPPAVCLPTPAFHATFAPQWAGIERWFAETHATKAAFLEQTHPQLMEMVAGARLPDEWIARIDERVDRWGARRAWAVRSSAPIEDSALHSFAGAYRSELEVRGRESLLASIVSCMRSVFSFGGVAAWSRSGQSGVPSMAVVIQQMVEGIVFAGVAASNPACPEAPFVDAVAGRADAMVDGRELPVGSREQLPSAVVEEVARVLGALERSWGHGVDLEWAWTTDGLVVLQARPLAASVELRDVGGTSVFSAHDLWEALPGDFNLGDCADVYARMMAKKGPAFDLVRAEGIPTGRGLVVRANHAGLEAHRGAWDQRLSRWSPEVVVELSSSMRQLVVARDDAAALLQRALFPDASSPIARCAIVREHIRGEAGLLSCVNEDGSMLVELSAEGLLALNRGVSDSLHVVLAADGQLQCADAVAPELLSLLASNGPTLRRAHAVLLRALGALQLEWVVDAGRLVFIDYSRSGARAAVSGTSGNRVLSGGVARGPALSLAGTPELERLSVSAAISMDDYDVATEGRAFRTVLGHIRDLRRPPVVFCPRPYAALAGLVGHVAGFVFEGGSLLCHLAMILREEGVPALISSVRISDGTEVVIAGGNLEVVLRADQQRGDA